MLGTSMNLELKGYAVLMSSLFLLSIGSYAIFFSAFLPLSGLPVSFKPRCMIEL